MRPDGEVWRVFELRAEGCSKSEIARRTGVSRAQVRAWLAAGLEAVLHSPMRERAAMGCQHGATCRADRCPFIADLDEQAYAYVLGQYLGDGTISTCPRGVFKLRIIMCDAYPEMMVECSEAIRAVMPDNAVSAYQRRGQGCTEVVSHSKHWPCLIPQHGPGMKHLRSIVFEPWQERIALDRYPRQLLRGLIHSDGCRVINWVMGRNKDNPKRYTYPRYFFSNESAQIRGIFVDACHRVGVECRAPRRNMISVARRDSVRKLDEFIGPKS
jgi:hypothetical protein